MSRSNPSEHVTNPSTRRFEWKDGNVVYYDKDKQQNVKVAKPFTFLLLDMLASVGGFHEPSNSGIYSNEIKAIGTATLTVKAGGKGKVIQLIEGVYKQIKGDLAKMGGKFQQNVYIAFRDDGGELVIGTLKLKGAALSAWMDFGKGKRKELYEQAISVVGSENGKKGRVEYTKPVFSFAEMSAADNAAAVKLDEELQAYIGVALKRKPKPVEDERDSVEPNGGGDDSFDGESFDE